MDPRIHQLIEEGDSAEEVEVILKLRRDGDVPPYVRIVTQAGDIATCRVRRDLLRATWEHPASVSVKGPRYVVPEPELVERDATSGAEYPLGESRRPQVLEAAGRGVIVAFLDWGCDFAHPNFRNDDGSTRLLALWDQSNAAPIKAAPYGYGTVFSRKAIDRALRDRDPYQALGYHPAEADPLGHGAHGTHVCDIAAGNGRVPGSSVGIAPEAEIIFVHLAARGLGGRATLGDSVRILEALDFVARTAGQRPWVVNLSLGQCGGPHTGLTLVEQGMDALLIQAPGRCIVQSTGNYHDERVHAAGQLHPGEERTLTWWTDKADRTPNELEVWYSGRDRLIVEVRPPGSDAVFRVPLGERSSFQIGGRGVGQIFHRAYDPGKGDHHIDMFLAPAAPAGPWRVTLIGDDIVDGRFHAWVERDSACRECQSRFDPKDAVASSTTGTICNGFRTIAVGAYDQHSPDQEVAHFSSAGPTVDGRDRPHLLAPGVSILAARSAPWDGQAQAHMLTQMSGTSMAAPHVTGTVACMFEAARRPLWIHETHRLLLGSTRSAALPAEAADRIGAGYLDIERAVDAASRFTAEERSSGTSVVPAETIQSANGDLSCECGTAEEKVMNSEDNELWVEELDDQGFEQEDGDEGYEERDFFETDDDQEPVYEAYPEAERNFGAELIELADEAIAAGAVSRSPGTLLGHVLSNAGIAERLNPLGGGHVPSPAAIFDAFAPGGSPALRRHFKQFFEVVAAPKSEINGDLNNLQCGDCLLRRGLGEGNLAHVALFVTGEVFRAKELAAMGLRPESRRPGVYAQVIDVGPFPHRPEDMFARRLGGENGQLSRDSLILRIRYDAQHTFRPPLSGSNTPQGQLWVSRASGAPAAETPTVVGEASPAPVPPAAVAHLPLGFDISEDNGPKPPTLADFLALKRAGKSFGILKMAQYVLDKQFDIRYPLIRDAGMIRGSYDFFAPIDVATQVQWVVNHVKRLTPGDLAPAIDLEDQSKALDGKYKYTGGNAGRQNMFKDISTWLKDVETQLGRTPIIYTWNLWKEQFDPKKFPDAADMSVYPLWGTQPEPWGANANAKALTLPAWPKATIWQYAEDTTRLKNKNDKMKKDAATAAAAAVAAGVAPPPPPKLDSSQRWGIDPYKEPGTEKFDGIDYDAFNGTIYELRGLADLGRPGVALSTVPRALGLSSVPYIAHAEIDGSLHLMVGPTWADKNLSAGELPGRGADPVLLASRDALLLYFRSGNDLIEATAAGAKNWQWSSDRIDALPTPIHDPRAVLSGDQRFVVYWGDDDDWHLLTWNRGWTSSGGLLSRANLRTVTGGRSTGQPTVYVSQGVVHVVGRVDKDGHLFDLWLDGAVWKKDDITSLARNLASNMPAATYSPCAYEMSAGVAIAFRAVGGDIWVIRRSDNAPTNVTAAAHAKPAAGHPTCFVLTDKPHIVYRATDRLIYDLWLDGGAWHVSQICTAQAVADPVATTDGTIALAAVRASDGLIHAAQFDGTLWTCAPTTKATMLRQPSAPGDFPGGGGGVALRPHFPENPEDVSIAEKVAGASFVPAFDNLALDFGRNFAEDDPKTFSPEDLASDMVGLEFILVSALKTSDGRSFAAGSTVRVTAWDNTKEVIEGTIGGSAISIPKELLAPKAEMWTTIYTSQRERRTEAIPLYVTEAAGLRATIVEGKSKGKDQGNNYKQLNKHLLIEMELNRFDRYIGQYTSMYNALIGEPNHWPPLAPGWVKSMMVQESTAGSAGTYLVEAPGVPMRTRFNVLQAIDSWGPQQFLMIQEIDPQSLKKSRFDKVMDDQRKLEEEWQRLNAMTKRNTAQQQRLDELDRLKFADIASRSRPTWNRFFGEYPNVPMTAGAKTASTSATTYWDFVVKFLSAGSPSRKDDYEFWIRTGIRWLFEKRKATSNWSDAVRAYNGVGGRAEFYRAIVLTRARAAAAAAGIEEPIWADLYCRPGTKTVDGKFKLCAFERAANPCEPRC